MVLKRVFPLQKVPHKLHYMVLQHERSLSAVAPKPRHLGVPYSQHNPPTFVPEPLSFLKYVQHLLSSPGMI